MTNVMRTRRLKELLDDSFGTEENPWISKKQAPHAADGDGIPLSGAKDIFSRRGRRNKQRGSPIDGFACLLTNLDKTNASRILIHAMTDSNGRKYQIFTDLGISELIGILRFPLGR